jgi:uncharacterized membrane protein
MRAIRLHSELIGGNQEMSDANVQLQIIVAAFSDEDAADLALDEFQMAAADQGVAIQDAAVLRRDAQGVLHTNEINTWDKGPAAATGSLIGGLIGWLSGPLGLAAGTVGGAIAGDAIVRVHNAKTPAMTSDVLKPLAGVLRPHSSAIVAVIGNQPADRVRDLVQKAGASNMLQTNLMADIDHTLAHRKSVVYAMAGTPGELDAARLAAMRVGAKYTGLIITDQGAYIEGTQAADNTQKH